MCPEEQRLSWNGDALPDYFSKALMHQNMAAGGLAF